MDKKKLARQIGKLAGSGAVFGLAAALVFGALAPGLLQRAIERKNDQEVQFQNGTEETEEEQEETQEDQEDTQQEQTTIIQEMTPGRLSDLIFRYFFHCPGGGKICCNR